MASLVAHRLYGPFRLSVDRIDRHVQTSSPGIFALAEKRDGSFLINRIGRSDEDLRSALKAHVGGRYSSFKVRYALSALDAFGKECELYHPLATLHDPIHPGTRAECSRRDRSRAASV